MLARLLQCLMIFAVIGASKASFGEQTPATEKIVVFGHSYPVLTDSSKWNAFISRINKEKPDLVLVLGDFFSGRESDAVKRNQVSMIRDRISCDVVFCPGNHEVSGPKQRRDFYENLLGYTDTLVSSKFANYVVINSVKPLAETHLFLSDISGRVDTSVQTIIFSHNRIWDTNLLDSKPYLSNQPFRFDEFLHSCPFVVNYIFAGNSQGQYFGNQFRCDDTTNINHNNVYWVDMVQGVRCYSAGMGGTRGGSNRFANYIVLSVSESGVVVIPEQLDLEPILKTENRVLSSVKPLAGNSEINRTKRFWDNELILRLRKSSKVWLLIAFVFGVFVTLLVQKFRNSD